MNYKLANNSNRLFGLNREAEKENDLIRGYVDELENGNLLVFCGSRYDYFNNELYEAVKPYVINKEKKVIFYDASKKEDEQNYSYFYEVSSDAKNHLIGIVKEFDEIKRDFWKRKINDNLDENLKNEIKAFAKKIGASWVFFNEKQVYFQFEHKLTNNNRKPNDKAIDFKSKMLSKFDFKDFHMFYDPMDKPDNTIIMLELQ